MPKRPLLALTCAALATTPALAASSPFDLSGPALTVSVTHDGVTVAEGVEDRLRVASRRREGRVVDRHRAQTCHVIEESGHLIDRTGDEGRHLPGRQLRQELD